MAGGGGGGLEGSELSVRVRGREEKERAREKRGLVGEQVSIGRRRGFSAVPGPQKARGHEGGRIEGLVCQSRSRIRETDDDMRFRIWECVSLQEPPGDNVQYIPRPGCTQGCTAKLQYSTVRRDQKIANLI
jgi:hypothetical protein